MKIFTIPFNFEASEVEMHGVFYYYIFTIFFYYFFPPEKHSGFLWKLIYIFFSLEPDLN